MVIVVALLTAGITFSSENPSGPRVSIRGLSGLTIRKPPTAVAILKDSSRLSFDEDLLEQVPSDDRQIALGVEHPGILGPDDFLAPGPLRMEAWMLPAPEARTVSIDLRSAEFRPFLIVTGPDFRETVYADADDNGVAQLLVDLSAGAPYRVVVTGWEGKTGKYNLRVAPD